jgi:hypothetical protein
MNNNYAFWNIDTTNWDRVYNEYQPKFAKLDIYKPKDVVQAYDYLEEIVAGLVDSHYSLTINDSYMDSLKAANRSGYIFPSESRHIKAPDYHHAIGSAYIYSTQIEKYLASYIKGHVQFGNNSLAVIAGKVKSTVKPNILYFYLSRFTVTSYLKTRQSGEAPGYVINALNYFFNSAQDSTLDGVIIDMRGNNGGALIDMHLLWGSILFGRPVTAGYTREKMGDGRLDYGPLVPFIIKPVTEVDTAYKMRTTTHPVTAPIVVLADVNSISCAELTTMAIASLPNGYFVGETTWGGNGILNPNAVVLANAGQFSNFFLQMVYTPFCIFEYLDGVVYEGKGFSPHNAPRGYEVKYSAAAFAANIDLHLEKAIEIIIQQ